jgi:hypothetical protein
VVGEDQFGEVGCAVAPVPLPSFGNRGPVKSVALEFSANLFRGNLKEKDLESISLNVIDQAHAPPGNCSSVVSSCWAFWITAKRFSSRRMLAELFTRV